MRMRKKPWARDLISQRTDCVISDPVAMKGHWHDIAKGPLHLEIGAGKGGYWIGMGRLYPDQGWIAVEKVPDAAAMGLKKAGDDVLPSMKMIVGDGAAVSDWFAPGEVDYIHLNFSDPWPKKGHAKRRLTYPSFLLGYALILAADGRLIMKTDNEQLFDFSLETLAAAGWRKLDENRNWREYPHPEDVITEYEQNFMNLHQPIYRVELMRPEEQR